jgi:hypothetical protein
VGPHWIGVPATSLAELVALTVGGVTSKAQRQADPGRKPGADT